jgi:hypothetical protein
MFAAPFEACCVSIPNSTAAVLVRMVCAGYTLVAELPAQRWAARVSRHFLRFVAPLVLAKKAREETDWMWMSINVTSQATQPVVTPF